MLLSLLLAVTTFTSPHPHASGGFGCSLLATATTLTIGAAGEFAGAGRVYTFSPEAELLRQYVSPNEQPNGSFGWAIAGVPLAVGAPDEDPNPRTASRPESVSGPGVVYSFTQGPPPVTVCSPEPRIRGQFGITIARDHDFLAVGAPGENGRRGAVHVFHAETYELLHSFPGPEEQDTRFGASVAIIPTPRTTYLAIGEPEGGYADAGTVHLYCLNSFVLVRSLSPRLPEPGGWFGHCVAATEDKIVVAAPLELTDRTAPHYGRVYAFSFPDGEFLWSATPSGWLPGRVFGWSVDMNTEIVAVGAPRASLGPPADSRAGTAHVLSTESGAQLHEFISPDFPLSHSFGYAVALCPWPNSLAVGAPSEVRAGMWTAGVVYAFDLDAQAETPDPRRLQLRRGGTYDILGRRCENPLRPGVYISVRPESPPQRFVVPR